MFTVNHEYNPSSEPYIIVTASSLTKNPVFENTSRTVLSKLSASSDGNIRSPAVAFSTNGVDDRSCSGTKSFAFAKRVNIDCFAVSRSLLWADKPGFILSKISFFNSSFPIEDFVSNS